MSSLKLKSELNSQNLSKLQSTKGSFSRRKIEELSQVETHISSVYKIKAPKAFTTQKGTSVGVES